MSIFEYDEQREMELIRRDEREIGERIGIEKERQNADTHKCKKGSDRSDTEIYNKFERGVDRNAA